MQVPTSSCKVEVYCPLFPSEDPSRVKQTMENILHDVDIKETPNSIKALSKSLYSLEKIYETIQSRRSQRVYRRQLMTNLKDDSTWFYLNKQAAFMNTIALCAEDEESPLGPIKIVLTSKNIEMVIDWLTSESN